METFARLVAHPDGVLAQVDRLDVEEGRLLELDVSENERGLDRSTIETWVENRPNVGIAVDTGAVIDLAETAETALVEASATFETGDEREDENRAYLVATVDGKWRLVG